VRHGDFLFVSVDGLCISSMDHTTVINVVSGYLMLSQSMFCCLLCVVPLCGSIFLSCCLSFLLFIWVRVKGRVVFDDGTGVANFFFVRGCCV
jgi:hypothetical protein